MYKTIHLDADYLVVQDNKLIFEDHHPGKSDFTRYEVSFHDMQWTYLKELSEHLLQKLRKDSEERKKREELQKQMEEKKRNRPWYKKLFGMKP